MNKIRTTVVLALSAGTLFAGCGNSPPVAVKAQGTPTPTATPAADYSYGQEIAQRIITRNVRFIKLATTGERQANNYDFDGMCMTIAKIKVLQDAQEADLDRFNEAEHPPGTDTGEVNDAFDTQRVQAAALIDLTDDYC